MLRKLYISFFIVLFLQSFGNKQLLSQNQYFSQFENIPLFINPAFTGIINEGYGRYRIGVNYKHQWTSVTIPYITASVSADAQLPIDMNRKKDRIGGGFIIVNDRSGSGGLNVFRFLLSSAYHKSLSGNGEHNLALGVHGGFIQKKMDYNDMALPDQYNSSGGYFDPNIPSAEDLSNFKLSDADIGIGLLWYYTPGILDKNKLKIKKSMARNKYYLGFQLAHINQPQNAFIEQQINFKPRIILHGEGKLDIQKTFKLQPKFLYMHQSTYQEFTVGADLEYYMLDSYGSKTAFSLGSRYRFSNTIIAIFGAEYKGFKIGISYDINVSSLKAISKGKGGFELSLIYISDYNLKLICPKL